MNNFPINSVPVGFTPASHCCSLLLLLPASLTHPLPPSISTLFQLRNRKSQPPTSCFPFSPLSSLTSLQRQELLKLWPCGKAGTGQGYLTDSRGQGRLEISASMCRGSQKTSLGPQEVFQPQGYFLLQFSLLGMDGLTGQR